MKQLALFGDMTQIASFAPEPPRNPDPPPDGSPAPPEGVITAREPEPGEALGRVSPAPVGHESSHDGRRLAAPSTLRDKLMERRKREERQRDT